MTKFRKIPLVIEAFRFTKERRWDNRDWPNWLNMAWQRKKSEANSAWPFVADNGDELIGITTPEGDHTVSYGDWIIQGIKGELYPCKPDIFRKSYEPCD